MKSCARCATTKPHSEFHKRPDGSPLAYCKPCALMNNREHYRKQPARALLKAVRQNAKKRGLEFTLTEADIRIPEFCPVLGTRLRVADGHQDACSPSVDRLDSSKGYTPDNIHVISWRANRLKSDATLEELEAITSWLRSNQ